MKQNVAGQDIGAQMITSADGSNFTGTVSALVTVDSGTQTAGGGSVTHEGNGYHSYTPTQAETNGNHIAFTFTGTGAITSTVQVYTSFPQSADHTATVVWANVTRELTSAAKITSDASAISMTSAGVIASVTTTTTNSDMRGTDSALLAANINLTAGAIDNVTLVATTTTNSDMRGTNSALLAADINLTAGAVDNVTLVATTDVNTDMLKASEVTTDMDANSTQLTAIILDTGTTLPAQITALNDITVSDILTTQMTEAYAADGVAPTLAEAVFLTMQNLQDFGFAGTTQTVRKLDGIAVAATYTLDDGVSPTDKTRAT